MGYYINPPDMSKEDWLAKYGTPIQSSEVLKSYTEDKLPVCLVDNGWMTAAGVAYNPREAEAFLYPGDNRPKRWFTVSKEDLKSYYPG